MSKPTKEIRLGKIKASIWKNQSESKFGGNSARYNVEIVRINKNDQTGEWETYRNFNAQELLLVAKISDIAHTWISFNGKDAPFSGEESETVSAKDLNYDVDEVPF